jgi:putative endonuclease
MAGLMARRIGENALSDQPSGSKSKGTRSGAYSVYILRCADGTLYTGSTTDVRARELTHNAGRGAKYTAARLPVRVVYSEAHNSRSAAQKREAQLKRWTRANKEALIAGDRTLLKSLNPGS